MKSIYKKSLLRPFHACRKKDTGISIIEIMIACFLATMILLMVFSIYFSVKMNSQNNHAIIEVEQSGLIASTRLRELIKQAGFFGCIPKNYSGLLPPPINGYGAHDPNIPSNIKQRLADNSSVVIIHDADNQSIYTLTDANTSNQLIVPKQNIFQAGDEITISDCLHFMFNKIIKIIKANQSEILVLEKKSPYIFKTNTEIRKLHNTAIFLATTQQKDEYGAPIIALSQKDLTNPHAPDEITENINLLNFYYYENINNKTILRSPNEITNWQHIIGVEIKMQVSSTQPISNIKTKYQYQNQQYFDTNRKLVKEWHLIIPIKKYYEN